MTRQKRNRLIVLSLDAVGSMDLPYMNTLPHFRAFFKRAAGCGQVVSVYPSLTYPAHTSIVTGLYPARHGIVNNHKLQPEKRRPDWLWQRRYIRGTTLYDEARKAGLSAAALLWPVTGKARIRYNLPEVWANQPWENQVSVSLSNGSPLYQIGLYRRFGHMLQGVSQPRLDNFVQASLLYTLKRFRPDLTLAHFTDVDANRHIFGVSSPGIQDALQRHDRRLGELLSFLDSQGMEQDTNVVVLGDHCQKDVSLALYPNYWFRKKGWLKVRDGVVTGWRALARECDGACYIYLKNRRDKAFKEEVGRWLHEWKGRPDSGIEEVFEQPEIAGMGADKACAFMLEARDGYFFQNESDVPFRPAGYGSGLHAGTHGYLPTKAGYQTIFFGAGPDFLPGARIGRMSLVDEGPLLARVLGVDLGQTDGRAPGGLLREEGLFRVP